MGTGESTRCFCSAAKAVRTELRTACFFAHAVLEQAAGYRNECMQGPPWLASFDCIRCVAVVPLCSRGIEANIHTYSALMSVCVKCK